MLAWGEGGEGGGVVSGREGREDGGFIRGLLGGVSVG